jgi:hypothetical protein
MQPWTKREQVSVLVTAGALMLLLGMLGHVPPRPDRALHRAIGATLARQALSLAGSKGGILVIARDTEAFPQPALDLVLAAFQKEVRHGSSQAASVRRLQVDPLRPLEVPPGDFAELIRRAEPGRVLVSLLGPPLLSERDWALCRPIKPKIVAFCPGSFVETVDLGRLLDSGCLHAAIISRPLSSLTPPRAKARPSSFDELYLAITPSNRALLPSGGSSL